MRSSLFPNPDLLLALELSQHAAQDLAAGALGDGRHKLHVLDVLVFRKLCIASAAQTGKRGGECESRLDACSAKRYATTAVK